VQHADVKLLTTLERVDSKTLGVEELLALAAVLADGLVALGNPATQFDDDGQLERESDEWVGWGSPEGTSDSGGGGPSDARRLCLACTAMKKMKNEREGCSPSSLVHRAAA
jgi:hypothetical protein